MIFGGRWPKKCVRFARSLALRQHLQASIKYSILFRCSLLINNRSIKLETEKKKKPNKAKCLLRFVLRSVPLRASASNAVTLRSMSSSGPERHPVHRRQTSHPPYCLHRVVFLDSPEIRFLEEQNTSFAAKFRLLYQKKRTKSRSSRPTCQMPSILFCVAGCMLPLTPNPLSPLVASIRCWSRAFCMRSRFSSSSMISSASKTMRSAARSSSTDSNGKYDGKSSSSAPSSTSSNLMRKSETTHRHHKHT